jgi:hypothetical protein
MAFDLLLPDTTSRDYPIFLQKLLLWVVASGSSTPFCNFLTKDQYRKQLINAGYEADEIIIRDVSERVFSGLAKFLGEQDGKLRALGLGGIGAFHVAKWVFRWWGRSGIVRGCIVVARKKR